MSQDMVTLRDGSKVARSTVVSLGSTLKHLVTTDPYTYAGLVQLCRGEIEPDGLSTEERRTLLRFRLISVDRVGNATVHDDTRRIVVVTAAGSSEKLAFDWPPTAD